MLRARASGRQSASAATRLELGSTTSPESFTSATPSYGRRAHRHDRQLPARVERLLGQPRHRLDLQRRADREHQPRASCASADARSIARSGSNSPNSTTSGFSDAPQSHRGTPRRRARASRPASTTRRTSRHEAVRIEPWTSIGSRARRGVQPVDVLRDHAGHAARAARARRSRGARRWAPCRRGSRSAGRRRTRSAPGRGARRRCGRPPSGRRSPTGRSSACGSRGCPDGTEMPAPVSTTTGPDDRISSARRSRAHWPLNSGARFSMNAAMPSRASSERERVHERRRARPPAPRRGRAACETRLICSTAIGAWPASLRAPGQRGVEQLVVLDDAVDEPVLVAPRRPRSGRRAVFISSALAGPTSRAQPLRAAEAGDDPEVDLGLAEGRRARGEPDVAGHRDLAAAAEREPVDGGDRRHRASAPTRARARGCARGARGRTRRPTVVNALMSAPAQNSAGFAEASTIARAPRATSVAPRRAPSAVDRRRARASSPAGCRATRPRRRRAGRA